MEKQACPSHLILIVFLTYILLPYHRYRVAHDQKMIYKYKATFCNHQASLLEANEDNKAQVLCPHFYQTAVLSGPHNFELSLQDM